VTKFLALPDPPLTSTPPPDSGASRARFLGSSEAAPATIQSPVGFRHPSSPRSPIKSSQSAPLATCAEKQKVIPILRAQVALRARQTVDFMTIHAADLIKAAAGSVRQCDVGTILGPRTPACNRLALVCLGALRLVDCCFGRAEFKKAGEIR